MTTTFISLRNGFVLKHPDEGRADTGHEPVGASEMTDSCRGNDLVAVFKVSSTEMPLVENGFLVSEPSDMPIDAWVD